MEFVVTFGKDIVLTYTLNNRPIIDKWVNLMSHYDITDMSKFEWDDKIVNEDRANQQIARLTEVIDKINAILPVNILPIEKFPLRKDCDWHKSLNLMHTRFPELHDLEQIVQRDDYETVRSDLSEMNLLIHSLEYELQLLWESENLVVSYMVPLSCHMSRKELAIDNMISIGQEDYDLFTSSAEFGLLFAGFSHIGRHPMELFTANDLDCPKEQYVPQSRISAEAYLQFGGLLHYESSKEEEEQFQSNWEKFYVLRGGKEFFGYDIDDPAIRFGQFLLGELRCVEIDGQVVPFDTPMQSKEVQDRIQQAASEITGWKFIEEKHMKRILEIRSAEGGMDSNLFTKDLAAAYQKMFGRLG